MDSQKTIKKTEEFYNANGETPLDPFAVDIFGAAKSVYVEEIAEQETSAEIVADEREKSKKTKKRPAWNSHLPVLTAREVEFSRLLRNLPKNLTRRAAAAAEETIARYTFQSPDEVKCRLATVAEVNLAEAIENVRRTSQVFLTLGCQPDNAAAVIALDAGFASSVIDLILGGDAADYHAPGELSPIENVIVEFLGINILGEINNWLGQSVLCLQKITHENPAVFDPLERGAQSIFRLNFNQFGGTINFFSGWDFLDGLDKTRNPLFEKKSSDRQFRQYEKIGLKLDLRLPIGTTRLTADNLLYLEAGDVILLEERENHFDGGDFTGDLQVCVGSGKNFLLSGTREANDASGEIKFKIMEITSSEQRREPAPPKLKMDEKELQENEIAEDAPGNESDPADAAAETEPNAAILSNVLINLRVEIAGDKISLNELQSLRAGQIIQLGCRATDPVRIVTDGSDQPIASGELVDVEGKLGVRVTRVYV